MNKIFLIYVKTFLPNKVTFIDLSIRMWIALSGPVLNPPHPEIHHFLKEPYFLLMEKDIGKVRCECWVCSLIPGVFISRYSVQIELGT